MPHFMNFDARGKLQFRIIRKGTKCKSPEEIEEGMASALSKDAFSSSTSIALVRMESRPCLKSATVWSKK